MRLQPVQPWPAPELVLFFLGVKSGEICGLGGLTDKAQPSPLGTRLGSARGPERALVQAAGHAFPQEVRLWLRCGLFLSSAPASPPEPAPRGSAAWAPRPQRRDGALRQQGLVPSPPPYRLRRAEQPVQTRVLVWVAWGGLCPDGPEGMGQAVPPTQPRWRPLTARKWNESPPVCPRGPSCCRQRQRHSAKNSQEGGGQAAVSWTGGPHAALAGTVVWQTSLPRSLPSE